MQGLVCGPPVSTMENSERTGQGRCSGEEGPFAFGYLAGVVDLVLEGCKMTD